MSDRYLSGMRESKPEVCWRIIDGEQVCILDRGHDDGVHERDEQAAAHTEPRKRDLLDLHREIETFVHFSPWRDEVPAVPETPVAEWGTLAWARFALALLEAT